MCKLGWSGLIVRNVEEIRPHPFKVLATAMWDIIQLSTVHTNRAPGSIETAADLSCLANGRNGCLENQLWKWFWPAKLIRGKIPRLEMIKDVMKLI